MKAVLIQPPFVQLNAPYPAVHYLDAFLRDRGCETVVEDHSIGLFRRLMSRAGLERTFEAARLALEAGAAPPLPGEAAPRPLDPRSRAELGRYLSLRGAWLALAEPLLDFLSGRDPGFAHRLSRGLDLPRGARAEAFLEERGGLCAPEEARALATRLLDDLCDLVSYARDPGFGVVRYAERLATSEGDFAAVEAALRASPVMAEDYAPLLEELFAGAGRGADLVLVTLPFPGCLVGGLAAARAASGARERGLLPGRSAVVMGGGYVSTELRALSDPGIFRYADFLAFDSGYGCLASIVDALGDTGGAGKVGPAAPEAEARALYKTMRLGPDGRVLAEGFGAGAAPAGAPAEAVAEALAPYAALEAEAVRSTQPDYAGARLADYLGLVESANPMHRLWSDTPWLKYQLARGCYWARCSFCDTRLEYVAGFLRCGIEPLLRAADSAARRHGLRGLHFTDEAMPMASLLALARENRARAARGEEPFHFWGNMRFDASWTADRAALLAASGLVAVSGGIEIATERGLELTDKGFDLAGLIKRLVGLKRAGLLVHAYLIYGFPGQAESEILDSAEVCRQLFAAGLVDSGFWHRFVLTRHSRIMGEREAGLRPELRPVDRPRSFAANDLRFEGEEAFDRLDGPLSELLAAWMEGERLEESAYAALEGPGGRRTEGRAGRASPPRGAIQPGLVESLIARAEAELEAEPPLPGSRAYWTGGAPSLSRGAKGKARLAWAHRGEMESVEAPPEAAARLHAALAELAERPEGLPGEGWIAALGPEAPPFLLRLRGAGLLFA